MSAWDGGGYSTSGPFRAGPYEDDFSDPTYRPARMGGSINFQILGPDGRTPVREPDPVKWRRWMSHSPTRILKQETLKDGTFVSTVFVGVDEWETLVEGGPGEHLSYIAYASYDAAAEGHRAIVAELTRGTRGIRIPRGTRGIRIRE